MAKIMPKYTAQIKDHSGILSQGIVQPLERVISETIYAKDDEEAYKKACELIFDRTYDRDKALLCNPEDGKLVQMLIKLLIEERTIPLTNFRLRPSFKKDDFNRPYLERVDRIINPKS